jgi:hypothetical protein
LSSCLTRSSLRAPEAVRSLVRGDGALEPALSLAGREEGGRVAPYRAGRHLMRVHPPSSGPASAGDSVAVLLAAVRRGRQAAWPFVTGLLPEGHHRTSMSRLADVDTLDAIGMLARFGRGVAGVLVIAADIGAPDGAGVSPTPSPWPGRPQRGGPARRRGQPAGAHAGPARRLRAVTDACRGGHRYGAWGYCERSRAS